MARKAVAKQSPDLDLNFSYGDRVHLYEQYGTFIFVGYGFHSNGETNRKLSTIRMRFNSNPFDVATNLLSHVPTKVTVAILGADDGFDVKIIDPDDECSRDEIHRAMGVALI